MHVCGKCMYLEVSGSWAECLPEQRQSVDHAAGLGWSSSDVCKCILDPHHIAADYVVASPDPTCSAQNSVQVMGRCNASITCSLNVV
jgi:hypothetical protein